jgi:hypothetical protein
MSHALNSENGPAVGQELDVIAGRRTEIRVLSAALPWGRHACRVYITDHELTVASSAVAALAIVGAYLGVRSANRNAVRIAREERSSERQTELYALKRETYAKYYGAILNYVAAKKEANEDEGNEEKRLEHNEAVVALGELDAQVQILAGEELLRAAGAMGTGLLQANTDDEIKKALDAAPIIDIIRAELAETDNGLKPQADGLRKHCRGKRHSVIGQ